MTVVTSQDSTFNGYSGLGTLVRSNRGDCARNLGRCLYGTNSYLHQSWTADALARLRTITDTTLGVDYGAPGTYAYDSLSGRHRSSLAEELGVQTDSVRYDAAGNVVREQQSAFYPVRTGCTPGPAALITRTTSNYYTADQHLAVADVRSNGDSVCVYTQALGTFEETRYDALGRRVLVRSRRDSAGLGVTGSAITRFVWDGAQLFWEMHYPGGDDVTGDSLEVDTAWYARVCQCGCGHPPQCGGNPDSLPRGYSPFNGRVEYLHAGGFDAPVALRRLTFGQDTVPFPDLLVYPMYTWQGVPDDGGLFANGSATYTYHTQTASLLWPARNSTAYHRYTAPLEAPSWFGSLTTLSTTDAGPQYRRNRYYDPIAGRFTQEDPLGLAGGLNLYGYAAGDPVNFSDPFGLDPCFENGKQIPCPEPPGGPPVKLPQGKRKDGGAPRPNKWRPTPGSKARPIKWVPLDPIPSENGKQPGSSWDPGQGHWDVDGMPGSEGTQHIDTDGRLVDHDGNPIDPAPQQSAMDNFTERLRRFWDEILQGLAKGPTIAPPPGSPVPPPVWIAPPPKE